MDLFDIVISGKINREGGGDITVEPLSVTQNGEYTAQSGKAYSPVNVAVPQPSGNINITSTAQTDVSAYATAQVVDADLVAENIKKDVNILGITGTYEGGGGGGGSSWTLIHEEDVTVEDTTSTSAKTAAYIQNNNIRTTDLLFVRIRDKAGVRNNHIYGSDSIILDTNAYTGDKSDLSGLEYSCQGYRVDANGKRLRISGAYGIYPSSFEGQDALRIRSKYSSAYGDIGGTYHIEVYKLAYADGSTSPFPLV